MRTASLLGVAALATSATAGHVSVNFAREAFKHPLAKRDGNSESITLDAINNITGGGYYSEFSVGTPPQKLSFMLDTGSSDTWVNSNEARVCQSERLQQSAGFFCQEQFDPKKSDTFEMVDENGFDITYLDSRNIQGDYFNDTVTIGDVKVKQQQLGLALDTVRGTGIMGLGFRANVAADKPYNTVIDNMLAQGHIDAAAFSLYLNDLNTDQGNVLFGAIDQKKFVGNLTKLPLVKDRLSRSTNVTSYNVNIAGFSIETPSGKSKISVPKLDSDAILDSGSTTCLLPPSQIEPIWQALGVKEIDGIMAPFIDCAYAGKKGQGYVFDFEFKGTTIKVPLDEMVIDAYHDIQFAFQAYQDFQDWDSVCMFGIGSTANFGVETTKFTLLGDTFLRSAYVVYDLENQQLGLAQANLNSSDSDIVEIKKGNDLPEVTGVKEADATTGLEEDNAVGHTTPSMTAVLSVLGLLGAFMTAL